MSIKNSLNTLLQRSLIMNVPLLYSYGGLVDKTLAADSYIEKPDQLYQSLLNSDSYNKPIFNIPPTPLVYPEYYEGAWLANLQFVDGYFTPAIPFPQLSRDVNIAGFRRYSIAFMPDVGASVSNVLLKFQKEDSTNSNSNNNNQVFEDRSSNLLSLFTAFSKQFDTVVDSITYDNTNSNRLSLLYHDPSLSKGKIELFTNSRSLISSRSRSSSSSNVNEISVRSLEHIRQSTVRQKVGQKASQTIVDYALEWTLTPMVDAIAIDSAINLKDAKPSQLVGTLRVFSYLQPQDDLYFQRPSKPVAVFVYKVILKRIT